MEAEANPGCQAEPASLANHLVSFPPRLAWPTQTSAPGALPHQPAAPSCWSQQGTPVTVAWISLSPAMVPLGARPFMLQGLCLTTEPLRRGCTRALGLPSLQRGARSPRGSCLGLVQLHREGAGTTRGQPPVPTDQRGVKMAGGEVPRAQLTVGLKLLGTTALRPSFSLVYCPQPAGLAGGPQALASLPLG